MFKKAVVLLGVMAFCVGVGRAETFKFWLQEDAWVNQANPDANYGSSTYLTVKDTSKLAEAYLRLSQADLDQLAGQRVVSAALSLYQYQGNYPLGDLVTIHKVTQEWREADITWANKPAYEPLAASSLILDSGVEVWRRWDGLADLVGAWKAGQNYGLVLENNSDLKAEELFSRFYSSEFSDEAKRPFLEVTTTAVPEPVSSALFLLGSLTFVARLRLKKKFWGHIT